MPPDENAVPETKQPRRRLKKLLLGAASAIALGILGNAAWELATKPLGHWLINVVTLGSHRIRDSIYGEAVHDPSMISGPYIVLLFAMGGVFVYFIVVRLERITVSTHTHPQTTQASRVRYSLQIAFATLVVVAEARAIMLMSEVKIWRAFHENMERCAPHLDDARERRLRAEFIAVKSKTDFDAVQAHMRALTEGQCKVAEPE